MAFSPNPNFVRIFYHSPFAPHVMEVPTRQYNAPTGGEPSGTFDCWDLSTISADTMITALVNAVKPFYNENVVFDNYIIYSTNNDAGVLAPMFGDTLAIVGTNPSTSWYKAVQITWSFRTTLFNQSKLVMLDAVSNNDYNRITSLGTGTVQEALANEFTAATNAWAGRDDARPSTFAQYALTLNEKLRRSYRMN